MTAVVKIRLSLVIRFALSKLHIQQDFLGRRIRRWWLHRVDAFADVPASPGTASSQTEVVSEHPSDPDSDRSFGSTNT